MAIFGRSVGNDFLLVTQLREKIFGFLQRFLGGVHLSLLDTVTGSTGQSFVAEIDGDGVDTGVGWSFTFDDFVDWDIRLPAVHRT